MFRTPLLPLVALLGLLFAADARAGTASVVKHGNRAQVVYTASPGETNVVLLNVTTDGTGNVHGIVHDTAGATPSGSDCVPVDSKTVSCVIGGDGVTPAGRQFSVFLGDGNDTLLAPVSGAIAVQADGGPGDDNLTGGIGHGGNGPKDHYANRLRGGPGDDTIAGRRFGDFIDEGGPGFDGHDTIDGGGGRDIVSYAGRTQDLTIDLAGLAGSEDRIRNVEDAVGGRRHDVIRGSGSPNLLEGGPGRDTLIGRGGNDVLFGFLGTIGRHGVPSGPKGGEGVGNNLVGGQGNDILFGNAGADRADPGPGRDVVRTQAGPDRIQAADGKRDKIDCGPSRDVAVVDRVDKLTSCEKVTRH